MDDVKFDVNATKISLFLLIDREFSRKTHTDKS